MERMYGTLGHERGDWQAARVAQHIAAAFSKKGKAGPLERYLWWKLPGVENAGRSHVDDEFEDDDELNGGYDGDA